MSTSTPGEASRTRTRRVLPPVPSDRGGDGRRSEEEGSTRASRGGEGLDGEALEQPSSSQSTIKEASKRLSLSPLGVTIKREFSTTSSMEETDGEDSSVTVAVRVRPFSQREQRLGAKQVVRMQGNETIITSGEGVVHRFHYDHCFWSFDHTQSEFADQSAVYVSLAQPLLDRSFEGFNTCLFAYGQTGSGKSYCIMGEGGEVGVVPQFCRELFERITGTATAQVSFKVQVSYYEIYNEKIYDLLASSTKKSKTRLRVREHPVMGPYVEDLSTYVASSYNDIEHWINLGNRFRATAATGMNDRSSRSHSVFTIMLTQTSVLEGEERSKVSRINLIDLAGSERSSVAQTSGERLKEGASINRSLHSLGKVISLLSERSIGKRRKVYIPYRDSTLTWLLKESLGGNSKTAMIATISPADLHHAEALSTLRYAHQARTIINVARINEDPNARIIRDLRSEIEKLQAQISFPVDPYASSSEQEVRELREKLRESEKLLSESTRTWQERLTETEKRKREELEVLKRAGTLKIDNRLPNLVNLNEDPQLSEMLLYVLKDGVSTVGRAGSSSHDIQLSGALVAEDHCSIVYQEGSVVIRPCGNPDAQTFVNGTLITDTTTLHHGDRVVFGGEHFFRFNHPLDVERGGKKGAEKGQHNFEYAKNELVRTQTEKIEAELERRRLAEREELMQEVQEEMELQRQDYEARLNELSTQMEGQSMELSSFMQTREETEEMIGELARKNLQLEQETIAQKHLLQLEKFKKEKELAAVTEQKTELMTELQKQKQKLEGDIQKMKKNKERREQAPYRDPLSTPHSALGEASLLKGTELVRLSMMLQEAAIISKNLGKTMTFSREENFSSESKEPEVYVRVHNTQLGQVTYWDLGKFETRLEQMRELYVSQSHTQLPSSSSSSSSSLERAESTVSNGSDEADPFHDPADTWHHDNLATPKTSPRRHLVRSFSAVSTGSTRTTNPPSSGVRRMLDLTSSIPRNHRELLSMSKGASPGVNSFLSRPPHPFSLSQSLPRLCHDRVSNIISMRPDSASKVTVFQRALQCVVEMTATAGSLQEACNTHTPTAPSLNIPFSETTEVRTHTLLLYVLLEQLVCHAHSILTFCHLMSHVTGSGRGSPDGRSLVEETCQQLLNTLSHQTGLYCSKLFSNIDKERLAEVDDDDSSLTDSYQSLRESLGHVTCLLGRLTLAWRVLERDMERRLEQQPSSPEANCWLVGDALNTFVTSKPELALLFYRGHSEWSRLRLESSCYAIQNCLSTLQTFNSAESSSEVVGAVVQLISTVMHFLQRLAATQSEVWGVEGVEGAEVEEVEDSVDVIPNTQTVVDMLLCLQQVEFAIWSLSSQTTALFSSINLEDPSPSSPLFSPLLSPNKQLGAACNELAASTQAVLRSCTSEATQDMMAEVQSLAQNTGRAVKSLSILLKSVVAPASAPGQGSSTFSAQHSTPTAAPRDGPETVQSKHHIQRVLPDTKYRLLGEPGPVGEAAEMEAERGGDADPSHFPPDGQEHENSLHNPYLEADEDYV